MPSKRKLAFDQVLDFGQRFGEPHVALAMHASVPLGLTPEIVHLIRHNFLPNQTPRIAEADLLLRGPCRDVGGGCFEMPLHVREFLVTELKRDPDYAKERTEEVASLLLDLSNERLDGEARSQPRDFWRAQRWAALAELDPAEATRDLADTLRGGLASEDRKVGLLASRVMQALALPLVHEEAMLLYTAGVTRLASGDSIGGDMLLKTAVGGRTELNVHGVSLPLPDAVRSLFAAPAVSQETESRQISRGADGASVRLTFLKTRAQVYNRGIPPDSFLQELVEWGKMAPDEIFEDSSTKEQDIYVSVEKELGPYRNLLHRKACMLEVMRVLAGFESSWNWNEGPDRSNPDSDLPQDSEAGAWQVSANSLNLGMDLKELVIREVGTTDPTRFQEAMRKNHRLAMEYTARLLRHTVRHHGPLMRRDIHKWLSTDAVSEFEKFFTA